MDSFLKPYTTSCTTKDCWAFSFLIPGTRENELLQIIGSHVPRGGEGWGSHMKGPEMLVGNFELSA